MTPIREEGRPPKGDERDFPAAGGQYLGFLEQAAVVLVVLLALGYLPTAKTAGEEGLSAMVAGTGVSLVGSVAGTVPLLLSRSRTAAEAMPAVIGSIALRLVLVIALAAAVALSGVFATRPLLVWVALSHAGLLVPDTLYARARMRLNEACPRGANAKSQARDGRD